jgi:hypothetical protein
VISYPDLDPESFARQAPWRRGRANRTEFRVVGSCRCNSDCEMECAFSLIANVFINTSQSSPYWRGSYGHEQLHVRNMTLLYKEAFGLLPVCMAKLIDRSRTKADCDMRARQLAANFITLTAGATSMVDGILEERASRHVLFEHPQRGARYEPMAGSPHAPEDRGLKTVAPHPSANRREIPAINMWDFCPTR